MAKKIKVLHITAVLGGVGVYVDLLNKNIDPKKFENILVLNTKEKLFGGLKEMPKIHVDLMRNISPLKDFKAMFQIIRLVKSENPDIIHCHSSKAGLIVRLAGLFFSTPIFYTPHSFYYLGLKGIKKKVFLNIEKVIGKISKAKILACSESEYYRSEMELVLPTEKILLWNNSINDIHNLYQQKAVINNFMVTIGRPSYQKNLILLLEALKIVIAKGERINLKIIGVGYHSDQLEDVKNFIDTNNLENFVTLIEWKERNEILQEVKNALFYISTSLYEGLPYSIIEAMSLEKAIIATNCDGNRDLVVDSYNGYITSYNKEEIAEKIIYLINNQNKVNAFGRNSFTRYKEYFNIKNNITLLESIYNNAASKQNTNR